MHEMIHALNRVIEVCKDSEKGFRKAAEDMSAPDYQTMFSDLAAQRAGFAEELHGIISSMGEAPETDGSTRAAMHRAFIDVRMALTGGSEHTVLAEAERGEDIALHTYEDVLKEALPVGVRDVLLRQYAVVKETHDQVRALRDAHERA